MRTSTADVDDAFYQIGVPEVASWFGIDLGMKGSEVLSWGCSSAWSDLEKRQLDIDPCVTYYPVIEVMPMGWSWALHFCHQLVRHLAVSGSGVPDLEVVAERSPAPLVSGERPALGIYVDNVYAVGARLGDSSRLVASFVKEAARQEVAVHIEGEEELIGEVLAWS